ncbi:intron-binding protein aquarius [Sporothrix brasiliensis 5110]|uniref:Intron-binding protein aquarius n=1 Tax=Sporothrix brasiliensis 5110 TaxID=1398154 RepID=A0A0C2IZ03_9PEZI|nr:intron-binding protein aquarius [Sporothrix brasiliensis 5110]KIH90172.1 intron-binding protein aquarius [Sporothrix brasiliensis 5110]
MRRNAAAREGATGLFHYSPADGTTDHTSRPRPRTRPVKTPHTTDTGGVAAAHRDTLRSTIRARVLLQGPVMPPAKKLRSGAASKAKAGSKATAPLAAAVPDGESAFARLAKLHWLKGGKLPAKVKVKNDVIKDGLWAPLEKDGFPFRALLSLETLQTLEGYLWPGYTEDASDQHVLLIVLITNAKKREHLDTWGVFTDRPLDFASFFRRTLTMSLDTSLSLAIRSQILYFVIHAFQSLDCAIVRKECAPLVSISTWHNISNDARRDELLDQTNHLRKAWRAAAKRFDAGDAATQARLRFDRSWLYSLVLDFIGVLFDETGAQDAVRYCERFVEFLSDLQSQLPTRRYVNALLQDLHVLPALAVSPVVHDEANGLLRDMASLLTHYTYFSVDDQTGAQLSETEAYDKHCGRLAALQRVALKHFKDKLTVLALSNYGSIDKRDELAGLLASLTDSEIVQLADLLHLRTAYPPSCKVQIGRTFLVEALLGTFEKRPTFQDEARNLSILPTEQTLFDTGLTRSDSYDGSRPLALPKLNLQYLSVGDFLWRSLVLYRCESFYSIRQDIEAALLRVESLPGNAGETRFTRIGKMVMPIQKLSIAQVVPPLVGDDQPSLVKAEVAIDFRGVKDFMRREWEALRPDDTVFLIAVNTNQARNAAITNNRNGASLTAQQLGITSIRTAEVMYPMEPENTRGQGFQRRGRGARGGSGGGGGRAGYGHRSFVRKLQVRLDAASFVEDTSQSSDGAPDVYDSFNLIIRRHGRENNFKPVLDSIRSLVLSDVPLAPWLHEVFLGYGDPAAATYKHLPNRIKKVDFRDTFLDWHHLIESLPGKTVEPSDDVTSSFGPPYVLGLADKPPAAEVLAPAKPPSKKRRRDAEPALIADVEMLKVSTYTPPNNGPYPVDAPKLNSVRFTPAQTEAIMSGVQPGLTVIVGPPGTGKTDVATQIINTLYHNFPEQRTLLVAHSNQALNQLFAKIAALDIDQRHLLRLGHGEEELSIEGASFSKYGRVEMFLENRNQYLQEVTRLAASIGAPGAHGNSAETAGYFNAVYIEPAWSKFNDVAVHTDGASAADIVQAFPFHNYFADAPQPLFPEDADRDAVLDIANGCYRHISKVFTELADVQPFEILRRDRDKANYLLTKEARIVAMTSTHAAMRRGEIAALGFHYDNVVVEEAAQITEIEDFIPLALQKVNATSGEVPLQRVVLCGDHLQNSPIVQNLAFRHYANLEQSLFSRLVRLGVPTINLDQQGRARPSIADLYRWRYPGLVDLPHVQTDPAFLTANAGFRYDYQFINVPDYRGRGESEPSPHFIQNLGEAEYAVALFQYMRLLGYPASKITILTTYAGQRALIRDVLEFRCRKSPIFGMPKILTTVDRYQGEQNDYIILSLTRTSRVGYLRDIRRLSVALSRARLGLYILGRREVFETCPELREAFQILLQRPDKLALVTGELWPSKRVIADENKAAAGGTLANEVTMEGLEHLGQYVFEMTQTRLQQMQAEAAKTAAANSTDGDAHGQGPEGFDLLPAPAREDDGEDIVALPGRDDDDDDDDPRGEEAGDDDGPDPESGHDKK